MLGPLPPPFAASAAALPAADAQRVRVLVTMGAVATPRDAIARLPSLALICCLGSGYEGVDLAAARARGILVTHSPGANASAVADLAVGLLVASVRQLFAANAFLRRGDWAGNYAKRVPLVRGLTGRRVGIYGLGAIGEKIARRVAAFETEIGYHNRRRRPDVGYRYFDTLLALATWADVLVVAVRADAGNRHAVERRRARGARRGGPRREHRARLGHRRGGADRGAARRRHRRRGARRVRARTRRCRRSCRRCRTSR